VIPERFTNSVIDPFEAKNVTPVARVKITNSPLTVKSLGLHQIGYLLTNSSEPEWETLTNLTKQYDGITIIVGFYSFSGSPVGILKEDNFAITYNGSIFPPDYDATSRPYTFKVIGYGNIRVRLGTSTYAFGSESTYQVLEPRTYNESSTINFGSEAQIRVDYYTTKDLENSGFALLWKNNLDTEYNIVSAGITYPEVNTADAAVLPTQTLNYVTDVSFSNSDNEIAQASFSIPIVKSSNTLNGYRYNRGLDRYEDVLDAFNKYLRKNDLIEIEIGYEEDDGTNKFIKKFVGNIKSFEIDRANRNSDVIKVNCEGFGAFLKDTINLNYPNQFDYWISDFSTPDGTKLSDFTDIIPDALDFVPSFDGWPLDKAVKALMVRGGIDSHLFNKNRLFLNNAEAQVEGSNLIENSTPKVILEKARNYGGPSRVFSFEQPDDEYRLKSNFGDTIFDYINKIVEPYGWEWGFEPYYDGAPYLRSRNNPTSVIPSENVGITLNGTWSGKNANLDVISGTYQETSTENDFVEHVFTGEKIDLISVLYSSPGGVRATISSGISQTSFNIMDEEGGTFTAGNRVIVNFPNQNDSATISSVSLPTINLDNPLSVIPISGTIVRTAVASADVRRGNSWTTAIPITGTFIPAHYGHNLEKIIPIRRVSFGAPPIVSGTKRMFYHGVDRETIDNPTIFNIATGLTRDEHIVRVTRLSDTLAQAGTLLGFNSFFVFDKDRNLPVYTFRTDDTLASGTVLKLDVSNDVEDLRNDVIVVGRRVGVEVPGGGLNNPINPNNPVRKFIVSRATDINSIFNKDALNFTGRPSQTILIEPSIGAQDRADYWAVQFLDRFRFPGNEATFEALGHPLMEIGDCIFVNDANKSSIDTSNKLWIEDINTRWGQKEAFDTFDTTTFPPWESFTPKLPVSISDFEDRPIVDIQITNGETAESPYDPYSADESGTFIEISFDMVVSGFLKIEIWGTYPNFSKKIADLLNPNGDEGQKGWVRETFGSNKKVTWDGVDLEGNWNDKWLTSDELQGSKQFFVAEPINSSGVTESFAKFYLVFKVVDFAGVERRVDTLLDTTPSIFIFTKRGEVITATTTDNPNFVGGSPTLAPQGGFDGNTNEGRGMRVIINRTNSNIRPAQLRIQIQHYPFGLERAEGLFGIAVSKKYGGSQRNFELNITDEFIDYVNFDQYLHPRNALDLDFDDWNSIFGETSTSDPFPKKWIGHYFIIKILLTDKSGRTIKLRERGFWEPTPGVDYPNINFIRVAALIGAVGKDINDDIFLDGDSSSGVFVGAIWGFQTEGAA